MTSLYFKQTTWGSFIAIAQIVQDAARRGAALPFHQPRTPEKPSIVRTVPGTANLIGSQARTLLTPRHKVAWQLNYRQVRSPAAPKFVPRNLLLQNVLSPRPHQFNGPMPGVKIRSKSDSTTLTRVAFLTSSCGNPDLPSRF